MSYRSCTYPDLPSDIADLLRSNKKLVIVGVIGKSAFPDCNKMAAMDILDRHPSLIENHTPKEGQIEFYYNPNESMLMLHFETTLDAACMERMLEEELAANVYGQFLLFHQRVRTRLARMLLLAANVCHIIVFVELGMTFDTSLIPTFKAMRTIRDKYYLKFMPKLMKNTNLGHILGKSSRMCTPRLLFLFENYPDKFEKTKESITNLEFDIEDKIFKTLRSEFIITNNCAASVFSVPFNKRFVYFNLDDKLREDPLEKSVALLKNLLQKTNFKNDDDELLELSPFKGFGKPLAHCTESSKTLSDDEIYLKEKKFMNFLMDHVDEALDRGFDDSVSKYKGKSQFMILPARAWYEFFQFLYKIIIENPSNPDFEANDPQYKLYLENFEQILDMDEEFFSACCDIGLQKAFAMYNNPALTHYSSTVHKNMVEEAVALYMKFARGPNSCTNEAKLREMCDDCWRNGKQQCEALSLRGNPCILSSHIVKDVTEHSSGCVFISACNCGRTQGRRVDPYSIRHANYEFYEYMASNCVLCAKVKKIHFQVFEPSINDYCAAKYEHAFPELKSKYLDNSFASGEDDDRTSVETDAEPNSGSQPLTHSQGTHTNLSLESTDNFHKIDARNQGEGDSDEEEDDDSVNELVIKVHDKEAQKEEKERNIHRQPSTTEYLPGMVHTTSPVGLLPQFPSWSLVCVGSSCIYTHTSGLMEHFQSGFLPGTNFLLPWGVHVRLDHSATWAANYEKTRYRKIGETFLLKIFIGYEYECGRGHRFMMSSPDKILRSSSGITRDSGSKVVFNNMPIYFPCPCRSSKSSIAQLMRIHVVTPKAPVNVILDPKVRTGEREYIFTLGAAEPPKLSQSAYWLLRLPYIYQGDDGPIAPPTEITAATAINYGCLLGGMFGVSETEIED